MALARMHPYGVTAVLPLKQSSVGGSGAFLVRGEDGRRYWCKVVNNGQSGKVPATEQIVARLGLLLGVAVCEPTLVRIPQELVGWEFRAGSHLQAGWAHGSLDVEPVTLAWQLDHRANDDNSRRHAGYCALYDWLGGQDAQWLVRVQADWMYYSHDHGHYLPGGPNWTVESLKNAITNVYQLTNDRTGLNGDELGRLADSLDALTREEIQESIDSLPPEWPVTDEELDEVVHFADARRHAVADRLRQTRA